MQLSTIVKGLIKRNGYTQRSYSEAKDLPYGSVMKAYIKNNCLTDTLIRLIEPLGYEVVIVPKAANITCEHYVVSRSDAPIDEPRKESVNLEGADELLG